jgi:tetratricopeptide (TPR) repeat protein
MEALWRKNRDPWAIAEAVGGYRAATALRPDDHQGFYFLGILLHAHGDYAQAAACNRAALARNPRFNFARVNLGTDLVRLGDMEGAIASLREALQPNPKFPMAHYALAWAFEHKGDLDGAIAEYKELLRIDPRNVYAQANLPRDERMRELLPRLADVLAAKEMPKSPSEALWFAELCKQPFQKRYAAATRLYGEAFAGDPKLVDELQNEARYNAAWSAAQAGCGEGADAPIDTADRAALRGKALAWLRDDLAVCRKQAASPDAAERKKAADKVSGWQRDPDLEKVRPGPARIDMPAAERDEWDHLWADVKATLAEAQKPVPATPGK